MYRKIPLSPYILKLYIIIHCAKFAGVGESLVVLIFLLLINLTLSLKYKQTLIKKYSETSFNGHL